MSENTRSSWFWLGAMIVPGLVLMLTFLVGRHLPAKESDWLGGSYLLLALVGVGVALVSAIVFTFLSVKKGETLCGLAIVSCLVYLGLFLKTIF